MNHMFLKSALISALTVAFLGIGCTTTEVPTVPPEVDARNLVYFDGTTKTLLTTVDYSTQGTTAALTVADVDPASLVVVPAAGSLVVGLSELLDGASVEAVIPQLGADGKPLTGGFGDWAGSLPVVAGFLPNNGIIDLVSDLAPAGFVISYAPGGGVPIDSADSIANVPPPALVVNPAGGAFTSGAIIIVHLLATDTGMKGVSGLTMVPAQDANGDDIVLLDGRKVGATIVFKIQ